MTSNGRILKSHQLSNHEIVLLGQPGEPRVLATPISSAALHNPVEEALLFTASEVEDLCDKARASGAADAAATLEPALNNVADALETFSHDQVVATEAGDRAQANSLVETALDVARWVLGRELADPSAILDLVTRALDEPLSSTSCKLYVHPELVPMLYEVAPEPVEIVADQSLDVGEFRVERDGPEVALRLDTALDRARSALAEGVDA